jgi:hypothetical protein
MQTVDPGAPDEPISWRAIGHGMPVYAVDGQLVGHVDELLGSDEKDVFHGIVLRLQAEAARRVDIASDDITAISRQRLVCSWTPGEIVLMPQHTDERGYALGWKKASFLFRHLPGNHPDEPTWVEEK